jgi:prepilin-type N-terminal cleavage/methylation domain-containing protein
MPTRRPTPRRAQAGFSFVEILVVMGIIAVLAGIGILVVNLANKKTPEFKTKNLLGKVQGGANAWMSRYGAPPPSNATKIDVISGTGFKVAKLDNMNNAGIESLYLCLQMPGSAVSLNADELDNTDEDFLEKPFIATMARELFEAKDDWGNPLVYFSAQDYVAAEKDPPTYYTGAPNAPEQQVRPRPWKNEKTGMFDEGRKFQLYSMGADSVPNTDDDIKAWE